jgi:signal transduction histidine kinase/ligand-binding sensor domain-containing protein/DNA-binding response OmpR family regulator
MQLKQYLIVVFLYSLISVVNAQTRQYQFVQLDVNKGLSHNMVNDFLKDSRGFMWFGTSYGLNRYDGYSLKVFRNIPGDTTSLLANDITKMFEGPDGKIWIYTHSGNSVYNPETESFYWNTNALLRTMSIAEGLITFLKKDSKGNFWFIHYNQGLFKYIPSEKKTIRLQTDINDSTAIATAEMSTIAEDKSGNIWIIHKNGVFEKLNNRTNKIDYRNEVLKQRFKAEMMDYEIMADVDGDLWIHSNSNRGCFYFNQEAKTIQSFNSNTKTRLNSAIVRKIVQDEDGLIWVATDHGGINQIDKKNDFKISYILHDEDDEKSLSQNSINTLYKDDQGIIWAGTYKKGISYYHENIFRFQLYRHHNTKPESIPFNDINAFAEDENGNLWIGTNGGGLIYFDRKANTFKQYLHNPKDPNSLSNNVIVSLYRDHANVLWVGTYYGGLNSFDGKRFTRYKNNPSDPKTIGDDSVWEIMEDSNKNLWIGMLRGGADVYDRKKKEFSHYKSGDFNSVRTGYVPALMEDKAGNMWIGTGYGLDILEKQSGRFIHYLNDVNNPLTLSNNNVLNLLEDSRGLIWVGTHAGLNLFDKTNKTFRVFNEKHGLPHGSILTIVEDNQHNLWMGTPNGISKMTISKNEDGTFKFSFKNYDESDGLQGKAFNENAVLKTAAGELVFGGSNGFNIFRPEAIGINKIKPNVILTDFQIFNKSVGIGNSKDDVLALPKAITTLDQITLRPEDNVFSIEFAAINYFRPEKSHYQYMLEGFNEWLATDAAQRRVTFTNIDPGDYVFKVKASNNDGIWNETPTTVRITILPPFWKSKIAFVLYTLLILGTLLLARWLILSKERINYRIQQERQKAQRMHELDMMKIKFFTNVSHEFRTPLTLILTPMERILKQTPEGDQKNQFKLIYRNAKRLLNLVNQLLDFRKMEVQEVKFNPSEGDIVKFIHELVNSFSDLSEKKNISFSFTSSIQELETLFDQDKVEKILFNLLSNAFKFTPENGSVQVFLDVKNEGKRNFLEIKVKDTGIGIAKDKQDKIFERFFQAEVPATMVNQGSGIGLSITKEFVKIHGGTITVESVPEKGTCFTVILPITEILHMEKAPLEADIAAVLASDEEEFAEINSVNKKPVLLLVEDNEDFRFYLKDNLKHQYAIIEASNGKQALEKALHLIPDLIVSDVMMPEMNGIDFCRSVKSDPHTSHIPVILLTARSSEEQKLEGLETGANDYITKPFSFEILQSRIKNLIAQREVFQKAFQKHLDVKGSDIQITSLDEKLIQNAIKVVETHMADPDFSVEELSRELGMSRVHLYKKLLSLTGKSPIEFIRTIRLQRAAQLLEKSQLTVAEVAYQVGFNNPKYFTKYFKDQFNILPSAYASGKRLSVS